jgi:NADH:ubiquinone oxidoreductase subunit E
MKDENTDNWPQVEAQSRAALPRPVLAHIDKVKCLPNPESHLIGVLHKLQDASGYLGPEPLEAVSQLMQVPAAKVAGVASFYHSFRLRPKGRFVISICLGTACYVKGAAGIAEAITKELGIVIGQTTADGVFSLEQARCLGVCGLAPVIMIEDQIHGPIGPEDIAPLLDIYRKKAISESK